MLTRVDVWTPGMGLVVDVAAGGGALWPPSDFIAAYVFNVLAFSEPNLYPYVTTK